MKKTHLALLLAAALLLSACGAGQAVGKVWQGPGVGMVRITAANGAILDVTGDHALLTGQGPTAASDLRAGSVLTIPGGTTACSEAVPLAGDYMVYDIKTERGTLNACMIVNGLAVGL